jgi:hypothetical protein
MKQPPVSARITWVKMSESRNRMVRGVGLSLVVCCTSMTGCSGGSGQTTAETGGGGLFSGIFGTRNTKAELTAVEGRKLLVDIQKNPSRMQKLTMPEKRFLAKAGVDARGHDDER